MTFVRHQTFRAVIVFALFTTTAPPNSAQSTSPGRIQSEQELLSALLKVQQANPTETRALLGTNTPLVTRSLWNGINDLASRKYYQNQPDQCLLLYEAAKQVALHLKDPKLLAVTHYNLARTYSGWNQYEKAKAAYVESQRAFADAGMERDLIYIFSDLGTIDFILEDYNAAKEWSEKSLKLAESLRNSNAPPGAWPDEHGMAGALATLGELAMREGDFAKAIEDLQRSLALYQRLSNAGSNYDYYLVEVYAALGRVYTTAGDHRLALSFLKRALAKTPRQSPQQANLLNSVGYLYMEQEDFAQAKAHFERGMKIYLAENNPREAARVLLNLGVIEQRQSNYDEALSLFRLSLQAAEATQNTDVTIAADEGIGVVLTAKKDFAGALEALNQSLVIAKDIKDKTRQTELLWRKAQAYYAMENYTQSAALAENAVALAQASHLPKLAYLATTTLGQSYAAQKRIDLATQTLKQALEQLEMMRDQVAGSEVESQLFLENKVDSYHALVDLFVKQNKPLDALLIAERAKGRVLLDVLNTGKSDLTKVLTATEKEETQRLDRKISEINHRIKMNQSSDFSSQEALYRQLDTARLEYQSFQDALYVNHPNLKVRSGRTASLTEADITHLTLKSDTAYLEYVTSKTGVHLFVLTPPSASGRPELKVYPIAAEPAELAAKVTQFHQRLADRHPDFANLARELHATLIGPAAQQLRGISTICIVPDGFLWNLPYQALMPHNNRYLIEDYGLYYVPSLSVLLEMTKDRSSKEKRAASLIAFGNPVIGKDEQRNEELCPLPEAETEVASVAKTFDPHFNKVLIGREASEKTFRRLAPTYTTIHLATHGVLDNRHPLYSHLQLTKTDGDPENDGLLEAREIMNMKLNADLAVLSACETANGRISPGEGVMGTSWAFFVAGTRSMLVSQWKVNSASTSQLMTNFYQALVSKQDTKGGTKAKSLKEATLRLMKDDRYRHPFYWAGFVLIGRN